MLDVLFRAKFGRRRGCDFELGQLIKSRSHWCRRVAGNKKGLQGRDKVEGRMEAVQSNTRSSDNAHVSCGMDGCEGRGRRIIGYPALPDVGYMYLSVGGLFP